VVLIKDLKWLKLLFANEIKNGFEKKRKLENERI